MCSVLCACIAVNYSSATCMCECESSHMHLQGVLQKPFIRIAKLLAFFFFHFGSPGAFFLIEN